jgi:serine/threonine-protein kinase RsbW
MKDSFTVVDSLKFAAEPGNISLVESLIDRTCNGLGVSEDLYGNVLIAVTEAVNNAIVHGSPAGASKQVTVDVLDGDATFGFTVCDEGPGFDYANLPDPTAPENLEKENGRGVFLMRSLADEVLFNDSGNAVSVYFNK